MSPSTHAATLSPARPVLVAAPLEDSQAHAAHGPLPSHLPIIVTIDGPAGTGKSSVARALAKRLGLDFLDTGAMYRACAAVVLDRKVDPRDFAGVVDIATQADLHFDWTKDPPQILAFGVPIDHRIRDEDVTKLVSPIAGIGPLRDVMVRKQRVIAAQHPRLVTEGRDQGSVVFPDAAVKFYLDARPEVRMRRRAEQLEAKGLHVDREALLREIIERDRSDAGRSDGPLICPNDAERVDTSDLTFERVVDALERGARARVLGT
jgi:cytidylate kinase